MGAVDFAAKALPVCRWWPFSLYEWAEAHSLLATDVVSRMTELKYFAPGTAGRGDHGAMRRVLVDELRSKHVVAPAPRWISDAMRGIDWPVDVAGTRSLLVDIGYPGVGGRSALGPPL
jgi:hypothetical protein